MAEEDRDWVIDGVVGFLSSPIWRVPILSFIEQKCIGKSQSANEMWTCITKLRMSAIAQATASAQA